MDMLDTHVLVLNKSWVAVHITTARRALTLLFTGLAKAVHHFDYSLYNFNEWLALSANGMPGRHIHSTSLRLRIPEVILLCRFNGFIRHEARFSRSSIFERDRHICQYCGGLFPKTQLTIDHVIPQSRGGQDSWENLVLACTKCNVQKGNRTPEEAAMPLRRKPVRPAWLPRFGMRIPRDQLLVWQRFIDTSFWNPSHAEIELHYHHEALPVAE